LGCDRTIAGAVGGHRQQIVVLLGGPLGARVGLAPAMKAVGIAPAVDE
jgi:hypothetical protein